MMIWLTLNQLHRLKYNGIHKWVLGLTALAIIVMIGLL